MGNKLYVGNLSYQTTDEALRNAFSPHGTVVQATIIRNRDTGQSRGFGFVEMQTDDDAAQAMSHMDGAYLRGRAIRVNEAQERGRREPQRGHRPPPQPTASPRAGQGPGHPPPTASSDRFHNPYTFVPTPPRNREHAFVGDKDPLTLRLLHDRLHPATWTGTLPIKITTVTPLLMPDTAARHEHPPKHFVYPMLRHMEGSSLRGCLRSAYETLTNSRYGCFRGHDECLPFRMSTTDALALVPARVEASAQGLQLRLMPGDSRIEPSGPQSRLMYAAWLPRYRKYERRTMFVDVPGKGICSLEQPAGILHGASHVWVNPPATPRARLLPSQVSASKHSGMTQCDVVAPPDDKHEDPEARDGVNGIHDTRHGERVWFRMSAPRDHRRGFRYTLVEEVKRPTPGGRPPGGFREGFVCVTGPNVLNKHFERVFFEPAHRIPEAALPKPVVERYEQLVRDYRSIHEKDRNKRGSPSAMAEYRGHEPGETGFSRHVWEDGAEKLKDGDLVFARVRRQERQWEVTDLFPVMISRELYACSPAALLDDSLPPADARTKLSPADRLFGWVNSKRSDAESAAAYRGRVRVVIQPNPLGEAAVESFRDAAGNPTSLPLAILGQPKPAQGRFYVAKDRNGLAQDKGGEKRERGYDSPDVKAIRGRKAYWHHAGLEGTTERGREHWNPSADRREFRKPNGENARTDQNRSISEWIKPGSTLRAELHVLNLQQEELGVLLYLLGLPAGCYLRLGYGKPLGFGSVRVELDVSDEASPPLGQPHHWKSYYGSLSAPPPAGLTPQQRDSALAAFWRAMLGEGAGEDTPDALQDSRKRFEALPFVREFLQVCKGPDTGHPIHYPRTGIVQDPEGKSYEWFVNNDKQGRNGGKGYCLPVPSADNGLPRDPTRS